MRSSNSAALLAALTMVLAACGGADAENPAAASEPPPSTIADANAATTTTTSAPATTTTAVPTTTTTTTTTVAPSVCPALPDLPNDVVAATRYDAGDGRSVDVVEVTSEANPSITDTTIRLTYADGGAVELTRSQAQLTTLGFFDTNGDGADELFLLNQSAQLRLWILTDADCELSIADSPGAPLGSSIQGGGEALLLSALEDGEAGEVGAGVACVDGRIRTHYFFIDGSPSAAGMVNLDVNEAELQGSQLVVVATDRPKIPVEEAAALPLLDCGDLTMPEAG